MFYISNVALFFFFLLRRTVEGAWVGSGDQRPCGLIDIAGTGCLITLSF